MTSDEGRGRAEAGGCQSVGVKEGSVLLLCRRDGILQAEALKVVYRTLGWRGSPAFWSRPVVSQLLDFVLAHVRKLLDIILAQV